MGYLGPGLAGQRCVAIVMGASQSPAPDCRSRVRLEHRSLGSTYPVSSSEAAQGCTDGHRLQLSRCAVVRNARPASAPPAIQGRHLAVPALMPRIMVEWNGIPTGFLEPDRSKAMHAEGFLATGSALFCGQGGAAFAANADPMAKGVSHACALQKSLAERRLVDLDLAKAKSVARQRYRIATSVNSTVTNGGCDNDARVPAALSAPSLNRGVGFTHAAAGADSAGFRRLAPTNEAERVWHQLQSLARKGWVQPASRTAALPPRGAGHFRCWPTICPNRCPVVRRWRAIQRFSDEYRLDCFDPNPTKSGSLQHVRAGAEDVDLIVYRCRGDPSVTEGGIQFLCG